MMSWCICQSPIIVPTGEQITFYSYSVQMFSVIGDSNEYYLYFKMQLCLIIVKNTFFVNLIFTVTSTIDLSSVWWQLVTSIRNVDSTLISA